ncbi:hypothetical protein BHYA_0122g00240 [Botrytis hyacinthi]|uniref:LITAF domain-containing protein n=1 Tax=Botrytis hyacinthi TaxID=278943 RepID=A0A4Z1GPN8_9HELO|nr:hypothetical protein BHYA_0122g00240 [Botrytis hyacinthi]
MAEYNNPPPPAYHEGVSPLTSPQITDSTNHNLTSVSPQLTGITNTSTSNIQQQPHQAQQNSHPDAYQGIEVVGPDQNTMASQQIPPQQEGFTNEKSQYQAPPPQGQYPPQGQAPPPQVQYPPQGQYPPQYQAPPPQGQYSPQDYYPAQPPPQANINQGKNRYATAMPIRALQTGPTPVDCPVCGVREVTIVESHSGTTTNLIALLCCAVTCLGCIPYLISGLKDVEHKCGHCGALLAVWHRSGRTDVKVPGA